MAKFLDRSSVKQVHDAFADMVFKEGLAMRLTKSKHLQNFINKVRALPKEITYKPPAYETLRTTLLQDAKQRVDKGLDPWERQTKATGCSICSDGWGDAANRPLLNVLAVNAKGAKFITAINTEGHQKTAEYIAEQLMKAILQIGPENVVQVGTLTLATELHYLPNYMLFFDLPRCSLCKESVHPDDCQGFVHRNRQLAVLRDSNYLCICTRTHHSTMLIDGRFMGHRSILRILLMRCYCCLCAAAGPDGQRSGMQSRWGAD
jgi:hypothetical protein